MTQAWSKDAQAHQGAQNQISMYELILFRMNISYYDVSGMGVLGGANKHKFWDPVGSTIGYNRFKYNTERHSIGFVVKSFLPVVARSHQQGMRKGTATLQANPDAAPTLYNWHCTYQG